MMKFSIKNKIQLGTLFLFVLLALSGGCSIYYLLRLKNDAKNILVDNYESLNYCHGMQQQLDSMEAGNRSYNIFNTYLKLEENNLTEPGEQQAAAHIRSEFEQLKAGDTAALHYKNIKLNLQLILQQNMVAIQRKNLQAENTAESASTAILCIVAITLIAGITFAYNFPAVVVTPIKKLTEAIAEISRKNYSHKIHISNKDEFGQLADAFNSMTGRLEEFESSNLNRILFEKARAEAVINSLKDASIGIDKDERVLFANRQALHLLNMKPEDIVRKPVEHVKKINDLFRFLLGGNNSSPFKIVVDGKENYYVKEVFEVEQDGAANRIIILKNITSFKELDVAKTNFIATVSHELKTPLASSDFSLKLLEDSRVSQLTEAQQELVGQLKLDNQRMLRILSELLNMSQAEAGKIQLHMQPIQPATVVHNSVQAVANAARSRQVKLVTQIESNLPAVIADADKLNWVLNNFLTNAIKFSPENATVTIGVKMNDKKLVFAVTDNGPGIEASFTSRIFERYFQVPGRQDKQGSGIGLAICREFIEAMGGEIWVKSTPGTGSVFGFSLQPNQEPE